MGEDTARTLFKGPMGLKFSIYDAVSTIKRSWILGGGVGICGMPQCSRCVDRWMDGLMAGGWVDGWWMQVRRWMPMCSLITHEEDITGVEENKRGGILFAPLME
eukprot:scaffold81916_cov15-Tisochrysis_lutea.AAC.1